MRFPQELRHRVGVEVAVQLGDLESEAVAVLQLQHQPVSRLGRVAVTVVLLRERSGDDETTAPCQLCRSDNGITEKFTGTGAQAVASGGHGEGRQPGLSVSRG